MFGGRVLVWVAAAGLVVLSYYEHRANATTDTSTAALAFLGSWMVGVPIAIAAVVIEWSVRRR